MPTIWTYTVSVSPTRQRGRFRVRCFALPDDDWNALGRTAYEQTHNARVARKVAAELAAQYDAEIQGLECLS